MCIFLCIFKCFIHLKSRFRLKNPILPIEKILSLVPPRNTIMLEHLIIQFSFNYLSSGLLRESKYKWHFQTFCGRSHLRELFLQQVPNISIWLGNFWYFRKLVVKEKWSITRGGLNQRLHRNWIRARGRGYSLTPLKGLKGHVQPARAGFSRFCPKQGIDFIFCFLKVHMRWFFFFGIILPSNI